VRRTSASTIASAPTAMPVPAKLTIISAFTVEPAEVGVRMIASPPVPTGIWLPSRRISGVPAKPG
jgi:hypothetical protein